MLSSDVPFRELGEAFLDQHAKRRITAGLLRRLNALGYEVMLRPEFVVCGQRVEIVR